MKCYPKTKKSFILIEVLVAITLLFILGFAYFEIQEGESAKMRASYDRALHEELSQQALARLIEKLSTNEIPLKTLEGGSYRFTLDPESWEAVYTFTEKKHPKGEEKLDTVLDTEATITLYQKMKEVKPIRGPFQFVIKHE